MGKLDEMKNKAKDMVTENRDRIEQGLEKAGDMVNQKTGGKHEDKVDKGLAKAREGLDRAEGNAEGAADGATEAQNMPGTNQPAPPNMPPPPGPPGA